MKNLNSCEDVKGFCIKENDLLINQLYRMEDLLNFITQQLNSSRIAIEKANYRHLQENEKIKKFSIEKLICNLLPIVDSLENSVSFFPIKMNNNNNSSNNSNNNSNNNNLLVEGVQLTLNMFYALFQSFSVYTINPIKQKFNPLEHEAILIKKSANTQDGHIIEVFQKGYKLNGRVVRASKVLVAKN